MMRCILTLFLCVGLARADVLTDWHSRADAVLVVRSGLQLWLDGADTSTMYDATSGGSLVTNGGLIARWQDKSGNSRHMTQATSGSRPTRTDAATAGRTVVRFASDYLGGATASDFTFLHNGTASMIFFVGKMGTGSNPDAGYSVIGNNGASWANIGMRIMFDDRSAVPYSNALIFQVTRGVSGENVAALTPQDVWTPNAYKLLFATIDADNGTASERAQYAFSFDALTGNNTAANAPSSADAFVMGVGSSRGDAEVLPMTGDMCELLIYNRALTTVEIGSVRRYLKRKWGLSL